MSVRCTVIEPMSPTGVVYGSRPRGSTTGSCTAHISISPYWQKRRNELIDPVRRTVEKVFGTLKSYGYSRVRYRGLERNEVEMWFKPYNLS